MKQRLLLMCCCAICVVTLVVGLQAPPRFDLRPGRKLTVKGNMFGAGSAVLAASEVAWLKEFADYLVERPNLYLVITGYTDNQGDSLANKRLSEARAKSVQEYLIRNGIDAARLKTFGKGSESPIASNETDEGRALNRRVEIIATSPFTERPLTNANGKALTPEGRITAMLPPVRSLTPWETEWMPTRLGESIYEYHRLETGIKARAEITFSNKHRIQVAEQSQVVIYGKGASPLAGKPNEQLRLMQGGLWVNIQSLQQTEALRISTNMGEFSLGKSSAKIEVDSAAQALLSVHSGNVSLKNSADSAAGAMTVPENFGTRMAAHSAPEKPRPLPLVPQLLEPLGIDSLSAGNLIFIWRKYSPRARFEVSQTITFDKPIYASLSTKDSAHVLLSEGEWYVRLAGIDSIGLESKSSIYLFHVVTPPEPPRFYVLTLLLFISAVGAGWWGEMTKQPRVALWSLALVLMGCASFFFLRW